MTSKEYIEQFRMDQENYEFSRPEFISALTNEFLEGIKKDCISKGMELLSYPEFKIHVSNIQKKFQDISHNMAIGRLSNNLWRYFFATVVVEYRKKNYPDIQARIEDRKRNRKILKKQA